MKTRMEIGLLVVVVFVLLSIGCYFEFIGINHVQASSEIQFPIGQKLEDWQVVKGNWSAVRFAGEYVLTEEGTGSGAGVNELILYPYELPESYIISGQIQFSNPKQWAGIVFEAQGNPNAKDMYYLVRLQPEKPNGNGAQMLVWVDGKVNTSYASPWESYTGNLNTYKWIDFTIERTPGSVKVSVDGHEFESLFKENMDLCRNGMPGFYANQSSSNQPIYFRNLKVVSIDS